MSDRQRLAKAKKQNALEGLEDARKGTISRLDQFEVVYSLAFYSNHDMMIYGSSNIVSVDT